jgi:hypothetical protein
MIFSISFRCFQGSWALSTAARPERRRCAVEHAREQYGMSERHACRLLGQWRGTQRYMGAKLNLFPTWVYLHKGTREGARALGLDAHADALYMADLPRKFHALKPHEIEDVLFIFKDELASSRQTLPRASRRSWCA